MGLLEDPVVFDFRWMAISQILSGLVSVHSCCRHARTCCHLITCAASLRLSWQMLVSICTEDKLMDDVETKSPSKNKDIIQWTPLSLSESNLNGDCPDPSLTNNHSTVASSETSGDTVFNCIAESSQTFPQSVRLKSYPEAAHCQKSLLDKSPAFMLSRKPRKFVYQVPNSDLSKTLIEHEETQPVCLDQMLKGKMFNVLYFLINISCAYFEQHFCSVFYRKSLS